MGATGIVSTEGIGLGLSRILIPGFQLRSASFRHRSLLCHLIIFSTCHRVITESVIMTSITIGGLGNAIATGTIRAGIGITPDDIGPDRNFIGHRLVILVTAGLMVNLVDQDMVVLRVNREGLMVNLVDRGMVVLMGNQADLDLMVNQADQDMVVLRVNRVDQVGVGRTLRHTDHKAKSVDLDLSLKQLADLAEADIMVNRVAPAGVVDLLANNLIIKITKEGKAKSFPLFSLIGHKFFFVIAKVLVMAEAQNKVHGVICSQIYFYDKEEKCCRDQHSRMHQSRQQD